MEHRSEAEVRVDVRNPIGELRDSVLLIVLTASSLSAYVGLAFVAVKLFGTK